MLNNNVELAQTINNFVSEQATPQSPNIPKSNSIKPESQSYTDEIKELKDLLDSGIITQEEFDAKKKQILGL